MITGLAAGCSGDDDDVADAGPTGDAAVLPDARLAEPDAAAAPDLACLGGPGPRTAPDPLALAGVVFDVVDYRVAGIAGARVELRRRSDDALLAEATTGEGGAFALEVASDGLPVDAWFAVSLRARLPTRVYPASPLAGGEQPLLIVAGAEEVARWYRAAGDSFEGGERTLISAVVDCASDPIEGATVAIAPPPATLTYYDNDSAAPGWDPSLAASRNGFALATGAAASVSVTAAAGAVELPPRTIAAEPGELTLAFIDPRAAPSLRPAR